MTIFTIVFVIIAFGLLTFDLYVAEKTFYVNLQSNGGWSKDEWVESTEEIPEITEFTACHWEKLRYFANSFNPIWTYCISANDEMSLRCIQFGYSSDATSAYRNVVFEALFSGWTDKKIATYIPVNSFRHRTWNHICWTYSSKTKRNKFYYNGRMIADAQIDNASIPSTIEESHDISNYAFVIGQEPDSLRGDYNSHQAFYGNIAELNMWGRVLGNGEISRIANCEELKKGDIISWNKKKLMISKAKIEDVDHSSFCKEQSDIVIFPERRSLISAVEVCSSVGGEIVVPRSEEENKATYDIAAKHTQNCIESTSSSSDINRFIWIGMENFQWNPIHQNYISEKYENYTNWGQSYLHSMNAHKGNLLYCAYMINAGFWGSRSSVGECQSLRLCTICSISQTPVFTIKGLSQQESKIHLNYYLVHNKSHQIDMYESYKDKQKMLLKDDEWQINVECTTIKLKKGINLLGRQEWDWYENSCNSKTFRKRNLTISVCGFGQEFTCNTGSCVPIDKRCDGIKDCLDVSDEEQCSRIDIPSSYEKINPPPQKIGSKETFLVYTNVTIENINTIDMRGMFVGLTLKFNMMWKDLRLAYRNLVPGERNVVSQDVSEKLWLPLDNMVYESAIIGRIYKNQNRMVSVFPKENQSKSDIHSSYEELNFCAEDSWLQMTQRYRIDYRCIFDLTKYPFDRQQCNFTMYIESTPHRRVSLIGRKPEVVYIGRKIVSQFEILNTTFSVGTNCAYCTTELNQNKVTFTLHMKRNYKDAVRKVIIPSYILWNMAYLTLFIKIEDFTNRNRISVTLLLALITLFGSVSIREDFPTTSYIKYIDIWFTWYLTNLVVIIALHIFVEKFMDGAAKIDLRIHPQPMTDAGGDGEPKKQAMIKIERINKAALIFFPITMIVFNITYFYLTT